MYYGYRCVDWLRYGGFWNGVVYLALGCKPQGWYNLLGFAIMAMLCHITIAAFLEAWKRFEDRDEKQGKHEHDTVKVHFPHAAYLWCPIHAWPCIPPQPCACRLLLQSIEIQEGLKTINMYPAAALTLGFAWGFVPALTESDFATGKKGSDQNRESYRLLYFVAVFLVVALVNAFINYRYSIYDVSTQHQGAKQSDEAQHDQEEAEARKPWYMGFQINLNKNLAAFPKDVVVVAAAQGDDRGTAAEGELAEAQL